MEEELPHATVGELKQELEDVISSYRHLDRASIRKVREMLNELVWLSADEDEEFDHVELDWEMVCEVRSAIAELAHNADGNEET